MKNIPFEKYFREFAAEFWPDKMRQDTDFWRWFAAQSRAESGFDPKAVSRAGACGLMQIMPATWREIRLTLPELSADIFHPKSNIRAGIYYDRFCYDYIGMQEGLERLLATFAAYNCGPGRIRRLIEEYWPENYAELEKHIPYRETREYVRRIRRFKMGVE